MFESQLCMFGRHETSNRFKKYGQLANLLNHFRAYYQKSKLAHKQYPKTWPRLNKTIFTKVFFSCIICRCCYWSHSCVHCTLLRVVKFDGLKRFFSFMIFSNLQCSFVETKLEISRYISKGFISSTSTLKIEGRFF